MGISLLAGAWVVTTLATLWNDFTKEEEEEETLKEEIMAEGYTTAGIQGSGKTIKAVLDSIKLTERGLNWAWITTQGERQALGRNKGGIIDILPRNCLDNVILWRPYKKNNRGFNLLKCYTDLNSERQLRAVAVVKLMKNMSDDMVTDNMKSCINKSVRYVLEYQHITKQEVTIYDAWQMTRDEEFAKHIQETVNRRDWDLDWNKFADGTKDAVSRRFGSIFGDYEIVLNALCYTKNDALDFQQMFDRIFIADLIQDNLIGCGDLPSKALAQAIIIQFDIVATTRRNESPYYQINCDEFYEYAEGIETILQRFPNQHRQRLLALNLIWQGIKRLPNEKCFIIAMSQGNKIIMKLEPNDDSKICKDKFYKEYEGKFSSQNKRQYYEFTEIDGERSITQKRTPNIPPINPTNYNYVVSRNTSRYNNKFEWWYTKGKNTDDVLSSDNF